MAHQGARDAEERDAVSRRMMVSEEPGPEPNGILFSPDDKTLHVISTGPG